MTFNHGVSLTPGPLEKRVSRLEPASVPQFNASRTQGKRTYKQFKNELDNARAGADTEPKSTSAMDNENKMVG